ncbi:MAG: peptide chain release factor 1 [Omnitrophica bacterium GWA2_52_8]|nr:MAG: peptide chain release factor 1 [Omnitrophica bacterium GWA2_52_8]
MFFPVSKKKSDALIRMMVRLGLRETDFEESFVRSSGPGGQNVNKVSTCVVLKHLPTGITVKCGQERSQAMNRFLARRILAGRIEAMVCGKQSEEARRIAKIKRQKRKRSKRAKDKILHAKHSRSETKHLRKPVTGDGDA